MYFPEPRAEVYCFRLNFNISKLVYVHLRNKKLMLETMFPVWRNWDALGKHARTMSVSGNLLPCFVDVLLKFTLVEP